MSVWCVLNIFCCSQSYCDDPDLVLELKNLIVIFADTLQVGSELYIMCFVQTLTLKCVKQPNGFLKPLCMWLQGYGFPVNRLFDLLFEVRDQYNETLLKKWSLVFRCWYLPMFVCLCHTTTCCVTRYPINPWFIFTPKGKKTESCFSPEVYLFQMYASGREKRKQSELGFITFSEFSLFPPQANVTLFHS